MILLSLGLLGWLPTAGLRNASGPGAWWLMGMANGFLPCGPIYAVAAGTVVATPMARAVRPRGYPVE